MFIQQHRGLCERGMHRHPPLTCLLHASYMPLTRTFSAFLCCIFCFVVIFFFFATSSFEMVSLFSLTGLISGMFVRVSSESPLQMLIVCFVCWVAEFRGTSSTLHTHNTHTHNHTHTCNLMRIPSRAWSVPYAQILQKIIRPICQRQPFYILKLFCIRRIRSRRHNVNLKGIRHRNQTRGSLKRP